MAQTSVGFAGTVNDAEWAVLSGYLGNGYCVGANGHLLTTAVGGSRAVSVAAGIAYGDGVQTTLGAAETVALATPTNGQWYLIVLRRIWATKATSLVAIPHTTTTNTTPTIAPTIYPAALQVTPGTQADQPVAWAWCNSANMTVVTFDLRLQQMEFLPASVASQALRDAKFPAPVQGQQVWRDDLGTVETFYSLYNASTNPGGRTSAGWFSSPIGRVLQVVHNSYATTVTNNSSTYVSTGLSATITPKFSTSRILAIVSQNGCRRYNAAGSWLGLELRRNGTTPIANQWAGRIASSTLDSNFGSMCFNVLDWPNTTSAVTYGTYFMNDFNGSGVDVQFGPSNSEITLIEVAA